MEVRMVEGMVEEVGSEGGEKRMERGGRPRDLGCCFSCCLRFCWRKKEEMQRRGGDKKRGVVIYI